MRSNANSGPHEVRELILNGTRTAKPKFDEERFTWKDIPYALVKPGNIDGAGGRGMSPFEVGKLTLAQAVYYLRERAKDKPISKSESIKLQRSMTEEQRANARRKIDERIAYFTGKLNKKK